MKIINKETKEFFNKPDDEYGRLYFIHHMHHFKNNNDIYHEIHHCFLFEKENMNGKKYKIFHEVEKDELYHCIEGDFIGQLFTHSNEVFQIIRKKINNKELSVIKIGDDLI